MAAAGGLPVLRFLTLDYATASALSELLAVLDCIPRRNALRQLAWELKQSRHRRAGNAMTLLNVQPFCDGLTGLGGLTSLSGNYTGLDQGVYQKQVMQGCIALEHLAVLKLGELQAVPIPQFEEALPRLPLRFVLFRGLSEVVCCMNGGGERRAAAATLACDGCEVDEHPYERPGGSIRCAGAAGMRIGGVHVGLGAPRPFMLVHVVVHRRHTGTVRLCMHAWTLPVLHVPPRVTQKAPELASLHEPG